MKNTNYYLKRMMLFALFTIVIHQLSFAQTVTGKVLDDQNVPLPGATISIPNTSRGTTSDFDGNFTIEAEVGTTLTCSYIGYGTVSKVVSENGVVNFEMVQSGEGLDEVIVSSRRINENLQKIPIAVSSFNLEALQSKGINSIEDVSDFAPNVVMENTAPISGSSSALVSFIRGIGQTDYTIASEAGVGLYIDGVYYARNVGGVVDLLDISRVEILKGPQGTLFGRNTIGGAINIVTKKPSAIFGARADVTVGGFNQVNVRATIDVPLSDNLLSSFSISDKNQDGYVIRRPYQGANNGDIDLLGGGEFPTLSQGNDLGNENSSTFRTKLAWYPSSDVSLVVSGDYNTVRQNGAPNTVLEIFGQDDPNSLAALYNAAISGAPVPPIEGVAPLADPLATPYDSRFVPDDLYTNYGTAAGGTNIDAFGLTANLRYQLSDNTTFKAITSYRNLKSTFGEDGDYSPLLIDHHIFEMDQSQFTQELQLNGATDRIKWVGGLYYFQEDGFLDQAVPLAGGFLQIVGGEEVKTKSYAAFGQASVKLTEKFGFTVGARYTIDDKEFEGTQRDLNFLATKSGFPDALLPDPTDPTRISPIGVQERTFNSFDVRAGLDWQVAENALIYASYSTGFKAGGWSTRLSVPTIDSPEFEPEEAKTYELGFKTQFNDKLRLNGALFYTDYSNLQIVVQRGGVSPVLENAAEAEIKGFELDLMYSLSKSLRFTGGLGILDSKYSEIAEETGIPVTNRLVNAPKTSISAAVDLASNFTSKAKINWHLDYFYKSTVHNDTQNTPALIQDPVGILNGSATFVSPKKNWNLTLGVKNIADKAFLVSGFFQPGVGYTAGTVSRPRYAYATFGYNF